MSGADAEARLGLTLADFLLELLTEEIPARMQARAADDLARLFGEALGKRGLAAAVECHVTPRRLALFARGLAVETAATREERRGPRADAPAGAVEGFLRSAGVAREALEERETPKGRFLYALIETPGRRTADVLPEAVGEAVGALAWPKSMRWGEASVAMDSPRWVRPLSGVVALLDGDVVPLTVLGVASGRETRGHRFMGPRGAVAIERAASYAADLRAACVVLDAGERRRIIAEGARAAAAAAGLTLIEDGGLIAENAGLTEWPTPLLGRFDPVFLEVPREVIQLTMRTNQKYFACVDGEGKLAPAFVCVANIAAADGGATIVEGNRRVLAARLADARFFWEQDLREWRAAADGPGVWAHFAPKLERLVFHEKLGTMRDKAERVATLARWLVESGAVRAAPHPTSPAARPDTPPGGAGQARAASRGEGDAVARLADSAERAGWLAKCDLVSAAVAEFPELQGVMGGHYAAAVGEDAGVAAAVREHYKPVGPSDAVPVEPVSVAVALADKLDTIRAFFSIDEKPTGSRDPYGLRRAAIAVVELLVTNLVRLSFVNLLAPERGRAIVSKDQPHNKLIVQLAVLKLDIQSVLGFFADRLKIQQREAGVRHDLIDAVFALGGEDDLVRLLARVLALQGFMGTDDGQNLLVAYRRAANILKQAEYTPPETPIPETGEEDPLVMVDDPGFAPVVAAFVEAERAAEVAAGGGHPAHGRLVAAVAEAEPRARAAIAAEDFEAAMGALAGLRGPIDAFFEGVMVNDPDFGVRAARLALLNRFVETAHAVADFSKIEG